MEAVIVTRVVFPSGITDGLAVTTILSIARWSLSMMVRSVPVTAMVSPAPSTRTVSSPSKTVSGTGVRVKEPLAEVSPTGMVIWKGSTAV